MNGLTREATSKLVQEVDELVRSQRDLMNWQAMVMERISTLEAELATTLKGCGVLIECDTTLGDRIDIVNKRLRKLETITKHLPEKTNESF